MSDRIKRMQKVTPELLNDFPNTYCEDVFWAADRIEELEAKLAKAVEEAEKYQHAFAAQSRKLQAVLHIDGVRTTIAELTGGKDE